ncbi:type I-D CRISPR-associated protein Cas10d/Csc3 [Methanothrix sp.]|uniref:type I-D CRISPR-associated protein Cas10d/Csc3 n=2 Tax=Methanothrix sp. TaxID=90426 RepID=UPI003C789693
MRNAGLVMLMTYQDGCVYLGKGNRRASISDELVERIYHRLEKNIQDSTPALSEVGSIIKNVDVQGNLNCYRLDDKYYFFSGPDKVLRAYIEKATVSARSVKTKLSKQMLENIGRALRAAGTDVELSDQDGRIVVEYARAIHAVHKIVSKIIKDNTEALAWSCDAWGVTEDVKRRLLSIPSNELTSGNKWEYAYVIARCVMDTESDGVKIKNMEPARAADLLFERIWRALKSTEGWDDFISEKTSTYREEITAYIHETLSVNGTISGSSGSDLSDPYREYQRGGSGRICNLCNSGTLLRQDEMKLPITVSMLKFNFSNRIFAGKTKPDNIYACVPCGVELVLRQNGCEIPRGPVRIR